MSNHKKQTIAELSKRLLKAGFRVFIAYNGEYGFYTDEAGSRLISFEIRYLSLHFSGNYASKGNGTGWVISDGDERDYKEMFDAPPPHWAVGNGSYSLTTLNQHLDTYQRSSKYIEIKQENEDEN